MTREALERQKARIARLQSGGGPYVGTSLTAEALIKLFVVGATLGALLGAIVTALLTKRFGDEVLGAVLGAVISGICTIVGAVIQSRGR